MKLGSFASLITSMFTDSMSINRYEDKANADGTTETILSDTPIYTNVECRISFLYEEKPKDITVDDNPVITSPSIFCKVETDIRAGDFITVTRYNDYGDVIATYSGQVGMPSVYPTHKQALFIIMESA